MDEGINRFPMGWRDASHLLPRLPIFETTTNEHSPCTTAPELLVQFLTRDSADNAAPQYDIVCTGPLTNLALALDLNPAIARRIARVWVMGGAVHVAGNVDARLVENQAMPWRHDGSAEWNIFNNPVAAKRVFSAKIPITLVSLDITNHFPLSSSFLVELKQQAQLFTLSRFAYEAWSLVLPCIEENTAVTVK
jgi:purine nucleosidase